MPAFVVKPTPDEDWYVYWSTVVDGPLAWGTLAEMAADWSWLAPGHGAFDPARFARADEHGSSAFGRSFGWGEAAIMYQQDGWVARSDLREFCERLGRDEDVADLLKPLES